MVAFDAGKTTFRTEMFAGLQGWSCQDSRGIREQFPYIREMLLHVVLPIMTWLSEADDIIGTLAKMAENTSEDYQITVVSGDKDLIQLTDENTVVEISKKGVAEFEAFTLTTSWRKWGYPSAIHRPQGPHG
ncbi:MAG: hypothetical protein ACLTZB_08535 [Streptococcus salivarius]